MYLFILSLYQTPPLLCFTRQHELPGTICSPSNTYIHHSVPQDLQVSFIRQMNLGCLMPVLSVMNYALGGPKAGQTRAHV